MENKNLCRFCHIDTRAEFNLKNIEVIPGGKALHYMITPEELDNWYELLKDYYSTFDYYGWPIVTNDAENPDHYDIQYNDIVFINNTKEIWTLGQFYKMLNTLLHPVIQTENYITTRYWLFNYQDIVAQGETTFYVALYYGCTPDWFAGTDKLTVKITIEYLDGYNNTVCKAINVLNLTLASTYNGSDTILGISKFTRNESLSSFTEPVLAGLRIQLILELYATIPVNFAEMEGVFDYIKVTVSGIGINPVLLYPIDAEWIVDTSASIVISTE